MMKNILFAVIFTFLLLSPVLQAAAQSSSGSVTSSSTSGNFDTKNFPQWAKDLRRWDIIAFGSFPFSFFFVSFITDMHRWNEANGMDWNDRSKAPWPFKSAGADEWTKEEFERTILISLGVSAVVAFTDLIIVLIKRNKERRRIESRATGTTVVTKTMPDTEEPDIIDDEVEIEIEDGVITESETE